MGSTRLGTRPGTGSQSERWPPPRKAAAGGHAVSASAAYLRASAYYAPWQSTRKVRSRDSGQLARIVFAKQQQAWSGFVAHTPAEVTEVAILYEQSTLPGWFFRADDSSAKRDGVVGVNGSDGSAVRHVGRLCGPRCGAATTC